MIKIGIVGYGNLGRGVIEAIKDNPDMEVEAIFTRRDPQVLGIEKAYKMDDILNFKDKLDCLIMCGGSSTDLPIQTPLMANHFNVVDSFDTHAKIIDHFQNVDLNAKKTQHTAIISVGWDPGMFSINRIYGESILPNGNTYTFWGPGVSQGHSDAIRRIDGVVDARQYTIPVEDALNKVREGKNPDLSTRDKHKRVCYVVLDKDANKEMIEKQIKEMPNYFSDYDTTVNFISIEELKEKHNGIPHGGMVFRSGEVGNTKHVVEYKLSLESNPMFTSSILVAYARACVRMNKEGNYGCKSVFDVAPSYLSVKSNEELLKSIL